MTQTLTAATDRQIAFICKLRVERGLSVLAPEEIAELTKKTASATISHLLSVPKTAKVSPVHVETVTEGMYRGADNAIYRVRRSRQSSRMLAFRLSETGLKWSFVYVGLAGKFVAQSDRMSLEDVKGFGLMTGWCCVCGRLLTVPESVHAGIGPVCAKNMQKWSF